MKSISSLLFPSKSTTFKILFFSAVITIIFSFRFLNCLPFSAYTREFNPETVATLLSYLIYSEENWTFPIGQIKSLAFPFESANIGNVGSIPLFAIFFKLISPVTGPIDYAVIIDIFTCFIAAFTTQKILVRLGIQNPVMLALGGFLVGTSFVLLNRSIWMQPYCVVSVAIYLVWFIALLNSLEKKYSLFSKGGLSLVMLFPIAILLDGYAFVAIYLGTSFLLFIEFHESLFSAKAESWRPFLNLIMVLFLAFILSNAALFIVGMYPPPRIEEAFTSYDFGMGGRYHVADLFSIIIPQNNVKFLSVPQSLPGKLSFPFTTDLLSDGQYEGISYIGTAMIFVWLYVIFKRINSKFIQFIKFKSTNYQYKTLSPWSKVSLACCFIFILSLGYELHVAGLSFTDFTLMPAAWLADRVPSLYNIRATGRLAICFTLFLTIEGIRQLSNYLKIDQYNNFRSSLSAYSFVFVIMLIQILEIYPHLKPIQAVKLDSIGGVYSPSDITRIKAIGKDRETVLMAPSVSSSSVEWESEAYGFVYYSKLKSNLYYLARNKRSEFLKIQSDIFMIENGNWQALMHEYGNNTLILIPDKLPSNIRAKVQDDFIEEKIGNVFVWHLKNSHKL
jgi:hypothetical protein